MGLISSLFRGKDINSRLQEMRGVERAVLLDVRNADSIDSIGRKVKEKDTPIYSYCLSGARSGRAAAALRALGYTNVTNIGGINRYKGRLEK